VIRIQALGGLSVRGDDGQPLSGAAAQPRRMAMLALLARASDRGVARERMLALLWPDAEEDRARNNLSQALYALRRDLGGDDTIAGTKELRLNPDRVSSDVAEFRTAVARKDNARAAGLYAGPFLDGFHVPAAPELARWVDDERQALVHEHLRVLEALARAATAAGDVAGAVAWWRKLASADPLDARVAVGLMEALAAAGDRAAALDHARIYEALLEQELDLSPDREVVSLAERLRREPASGTPAAAPRAPPERPRAPLLAPAAVPAVSASTAPAPAATVSAAVAPEEPIAPGSVTPPSMEVLDGRDTRVPTADVLGAPALALPAARSRRMRGAVAAVVVAVMGAAAVAAGLYARSERRGPARVPVVAVGHIAGYDLGAGAGGGTAPLADLLATNLARVPGLRVVSAGRMLEVAQGAGGAADTSAGAQTAVARAAGATELVDGTLYGRPNGRLRLDLRRVDLATGAIVDARTVEGPDLFALVDSGTAQLAAHLGASAPAGSVADVTTRSLAAYRLYVEGLRRYYALDWAGAERLLGAAVAEDSTFAMATYYWALTTYEAGAAMARMQRAARLAPSASERERLIILAGLALRSSAPELGPIADTLATRYPDEVEGHLYRGAALMMAEDFLAAVPHLQRAMRMDSLALRVAGGGRGDACAGCEARAQLIYAYQAADSPAAAEREARSWTRYAPGSPGAWLALAGVLVTRARPAEALVALDSARAVGGAGNSVVQDALALHWIYVGNYARAEELLRVRAATGASADQGEAFWFLAIAYREQGRLVDALAAARRHRVAITGREPPLGPGTAPGSALLEAVMLDELGRHREAAALFDSVSRGRVPGLAPSRFARHRAWTLTHAASALAAGGDTGALAARADTVAAYGARSGLGRDQRLFHHVRGLALAARGNDAAAVDEFRAFIRSPTFGYTRSNAELARALLRLGRPAEAVAALQPALRGGVDGANLYVSRTVLHELLAQAWDAAGRPDSAAAHFAMVARSWRGGDPPFRARASAAQSRIAALRT
jgi:DNA-binding SARP family transcriptional activator